MTKQQNKEEKEERGERLTPKQELFIQEYLIDLNGKQAAIRAGYAPLNAEITASKLLTVAKVRDAIDAAKKARVEAIKRSAEDVLRDIEAVKADAMQKVPDRDGNMVMLNHTAALKALELEGRHRAMFTDKSEVTGANGGPIDQNVTVSFVKP